LNERELKLRLLRDVALAPTSCVGWICGAYGYHTFFFSERRGLFLLVLKEEDEMWRGDD
jgi:hypothetical protein